MNWSDIFILYCLPILSFVLIACAGYYYGHEMGYIAGVQAEAENTRETALHTVSMCGLLCNATVTGFNGGGGVRGMAYGDYFIVRADNQDIQDTLDTCAHEWAHVHEGLKDP